VTDDVRAVLAAKRTEIEAELAQLQAPADDAGGISFGKRVGDGTSIAVERITQVDASDRLQAMLADVVRARLGPGARAEDLVLQAAGQRRHPRPNPPGKLLKGFRHQPVAPAETAKPEVASPEQV